MVRAHRRPGPGRSPPGGLAASPPGARVAGPAAPPVPRRLGLVAPGRAVIELSGFAEDEPTAVALDVYGLPVSLRGDWPEVLDALAGDFAWFRTSGEATRPGLTIAVRRRAPDYAAFGSLTATFVTPRNVVYRDGERTIVDYFGRAATVLDSAAGHAEIQGVDAHLVHEAAYHLVLSRVGEHLERTGLVRLHALGLCGAQGGVAVMLPSGGGKSTLAFSALGADGVRLLSDDSPLIDTHGRLHPFPLRIAVNETDAALLPAEGVRRIERMEVHPKLLLDVHAFAARIESGSPPLRHLVIGHRTLRSDSALTPVPRRTAVGPLLREAVVGVGLYQGMEFVLQRGALDVLGQARPAARRTAACAAALRGSRVWRLELGLDREANWASLNRLLV